MLSSYYYYLCLLAEIMVLGSQDCGRLWTLVGSFSIIFPFSPSQEFQIPIGVPCASIKPGYSPRLSEFRAQEC